MPRSPFPVGILLAQWQPGIANFVRHLKILAVYTLRDLDIEGYCISLTGYHAILERIACLVHHLAGARIHFGDTLRQLFLILFASS